MLPVRQEYRSQLPGLVHDQSASGATVYDQEEVKNLLKEADALVKAYKETHTDWL